MRPQLFTRSVVNVFGAIEEQMLINMAKHLKQHKSFFTADKIQSWQALQLRELGNLRQDQIMLIAKHSGLAIDGITEMLEQAGYKAITEIDMQLKEAVRLGKVIKPPEHQGLITRITTVYQRQAIDTCNLIGSTMLDQSQQMVIDQVSKMVGKVLAGAQTADQARRSLIIQWNDHGVPALIDKIGRRWSPEAYVSMVTRTLSNRVANIAQDERIDAYGIDLVEISAHLGARRLCAPYQGKIFSRSGQSKQYPPFSETSYGELAGLFGINCGHVKYPYVEGVNTKRSESYEKKVNEQAYQESQKQRYYERQIRKAKREQNMMQALGDSEGVKQAGIKIREKQANMREFIKVTGRTRRRNREWVSTR